MNNTLLLLDLHTGGVLYSTRLREILTGLLAAVLDTLPFSISLDLSPELGQFNFEDDFLQLSPIDRIFRPMDPALITEEFLQRRQLAQEKGLALRDLQIICEAARDTLTLGVPAEVYADLETELSKYKNSGGDFSPAIVEYASILELSPEVCVQELRMKVESARLIRIRNFAIYQKYLEIICRSKPDDLKDIRLKIQTEVFKNSHV